jgi:hypothetical protein
MTNDPLKACLLFLSLVFLLGMGQTQRAPNHTATANTNASMAPEEIPTPGLLEFIATFDSGDGRFTDPELLEVLGPRTPRGTTHE